MKLRAAASAVLIFLSASLALAVNEDAATAYPVPTGCTDVTVSTMTPAVGQPVEVYGTHFLANTSVSFTLIPVTAGKPQFGLPTQTSDANGALSFSFVMPSGSLNQGGYLVHAGSGIGPLGLCTGDPLVRLVAATTTTSGGTSGTSFTGVDIASLVALAAALIIVGTLLAVRRERRPHRSRR